MSNAKFDPPTTHFGYKAVPTDQKVEKVAEVFTSVSPKYDLMNDLMSLGVHRIWKRMTVDMSHVRPGHKVLDVAGGTGDLTSLFSKKVGRDGHVCLLDINYSMIQEGRARLLDKGVSENVSFLQADAEKLPFPDDHFDCISIGFGLRNVTRKEEALKSMYRVLKPGGQCLVLEFSKPTIPGLSKIYDVYSFSVLPRLGKLIANDSESYNYLAESIRVHPSQKELKNMMLDAGFENCHYHNLCGGIVAIHRGYKF